MIQDGRFHIPYRQPSDQEKAESFINELLMYPKGTCDLVMAMWLATQHMRLNKNQYYFTAGPGDKVKYFKNPAYHSC